jgi:Na+:H+ antiporter
VLLIGAIIIIPRIVNAERLWKARGSIEGIVTASFFGASAIAAAVGLSPIVGAFSVGMAVASTKIIKRVEEYVDKLEIIFAPLFFAIIGAQVNLTGVNLDVLFLSAIVVVVAIFSKLVGCGLPAMMFLREKSKAMKVGIGMISRGEVGLIVAGIGVTSGALSSNIYTTVIIMVAITTLITPVWLKKAYGKEPAVANDDSRPIQ